MHEYQQTHVNRDASPTIRGYVYQVDMTILRWLDLQPQQVLELERGEDIDTVLLAQNESRKEEGRVLEQVKYRENASITIRTADVITAIVHAFEHRLANPALSIYFRYTTNATIGQEQTSPFSVQRAAIQAWQDLSINTYKELTRSEMLNGIRTLLLDSTKPEDISSASWTIFHNSLLSAGENEFADFLQAFQWNVGNLDAYHMSHEIIQRLIYNKHANSIAQAQEQYQRLFVHVFQILSTRTKKQLTLQDRQDLLSNRSLSEQGHHVINVVFKEHFSGLEQRITRLEQNLRDIEQKRNEEKIVQFRSMLIEHHSFTNGLLENFVGRIYELKEIQECITRLQQTGGYVTITGEAGEGKSSVIAKLIQQYSEERPVSHFIPLRQKPGYQIALLRHIVASFILKYELYHHSDIGDQVATLQVLLSNILLEVSAISNREIVFIDGLDQLPSDFQGKRDLSFLPDHLPPNVVFVLGTRPNDTVDDLLLLTPIESYPLPHFHRQDFDQILHHYQVGLENGVIDYLYQIMQANVLFLHLAAKELRGHSFSEELLARITSNPEAIFSLSIERLKVSRPDWQQVIKPILGLLLTVQEALSLEQMESIFNDIEYDSLQDNIKRLGGLIIEDTNHRYTLYHLKFQEYLLKGSLFSTKDKKQYHLLLLQWCEREELNSIWKNVTDIQEQARREYARQYYVFHLYYAENQQKLFEILDEGSYGKGKIHQGSGIPSYVADLDLGQQAAMQQRWVLQEEIENLPRLWRYTLLRCSLSSLADNYPDDAFHLLLLLKRDSEAAGLAEHLTDDNRRISILLLIVENMIRDPISSSKAMKIITQLQNQILSLKGKNIDTTILGELSMILAQAGLQEQVHQLSGYIKSPYQRSIISNELGTNFARLGNLEIAAKTWRDAEDLIKDIESIEEKVDALHRLSQSFAQVRRWDDVQRIIKRIDSFGSGSFFLHSWELDLLNSMQQGEEIEPKGNAINREIDKLQKLPWRFKYLNHDEVELIRTSQWDEAKKRIIASWRNEVDLIHALSELLQAQVTANQEEDARNICKIIQEKTRRITSDKSKIEVWCELGKCLALTNQDDEAKALWARIKATTQFIKDDKMRARVLHQLAKTLMQAQEWKQVRKIIDAIENNSVKFLAGNHFGKALALKGLKIEAQEIWQETEKSILEIRDERTKCWHLTQLSISIAQTQEWNSARAIIQSISIYHWRLQAQKEFIQILAYSQKWDDIEQELQYIKDEREKAEVIRKVTSTLIQREDWDLAESLVQNQNNSYWKLSLMNELGRALIQSGEKRKALDHLKITEKALQDSESKRTQPKKTRFPSSIIPPLIPYKKWQRLVDILPNATGVSVESWELKKLGKMLISIQEWEWAEQIILSIKQDKTKVDALIDLGKAFTLGGLYEKAEQIWVLTRNIISGMQNEDTQLWVQKSMIVAFASLDRWEEAEQIAKSISTNSEMRFKINLELAKALSLDGQQDRALFYWQEAETIFELQNLDFAKERSQRYKIEYAATLIQAKQWLKAEKVAREIENKTQQYCILQKIAKDLIGERKEELLLRIIQQACIQAKNRTQAMDVMMLAAEFILIYPQFGYSFFSTFQWTDTFIGTNPY